VVVEEVAPPKDIEDIAAVNMDHHTVEECSLEGRLVVVVDGNCCDRIVVDAAAAAAVGLQRGHYHYYRHRRALVLLFGLY